MIYIAAGTHAEATFEARQLLLTRPEYIELDSGLPLVGRSVSATDDLRIVGTFWDRRDAGHVLDMWDICRMRAGLR